MLLSVLTPTFNCARTLPDTLDSVSELQEKFSLRQLSTPKGTFQVEVKRESNAVKELQLRDSRFESPQEFIIFSTEFQPSPDAVEEF